MHTKIMIQPTCLHYKLTDNNLIEDKGLNIFCVNYSVYLINLNSQPMVFTEFVYLRVSFSEHFTRKGILVKLDEPLTCEFIDYAILDTKNGNKDVGVVVSQNRYYFVPRLALCVMA